MTDIQNRELFSTRQWAGVVVYIVAILGYAFLSGEILLGFLVILLSLSIVFFTVLFYRFVLAVERIADKL